MKCPEKRNLDKIVRPPHGGRLYQVPPKQPCPSISQNLSSNDDDEGEKESDILLIEDLDSGDDMNGIN